ncbi:hypothetical protein ACFP8W_19105, partial [Nocardioides hankookensis]
MHADWFSDDEPFLRPYAGEVSDRLTNETVLLLRGVGVDGWSVGALARAMNVTPQALLNEYPRARVIELVCIVFGRRWRSWSGPDRQHDLPARLPRSATERHAVQVLRALDELPRGEAARGRPAPSAILAGLVDDERDRLGAELDRICGRRVTDLETCHVHALVTGLRLALVDDPSPNERHLSWESAAGILRSAVAGV